MIAFRVPNVIVKALDKEEKVSTTRCQKMPRGSMVCFQTLPFELLFFRLSKLCALSTLGAPSLVHRDIRDLGLCAFPMSIIGN